MHVLTVSDGIKFKIHFRKNAVGELGITVQHRYTPTSTADDGKYDTDDKYNDDNSNEVILVLMILTTLILILIMIAMVMIIDHDGEYSVCNIDDETDSSIYLSVTPVGISTISMIPMQ